MSNDLLKGSGILTNNRRKRHGLTGGTGARRRRFEHKSATSRPASAIAYRVSMSRPRPSERAPSDDETFPCRCVSNVSPRLGMSVCDDDCACP